MGGVYLSESRETPGALALDHGAQGLMDESGPLRRAHEALRLTEQVCRRDLMWRAWRALPSIDVTLAVRRRRRSSRRRRAALSRG